MPWFITAIMSNETLKKRPFYKTCRSRTFGFYETYKEAYTACAENHGSMGECIYDYLIMEYIEPGIHSCVFSTQWWEWDAAMHNWAFLPEEYTPEEFQGITNWALG